MKTKLLKRLRREFGRYYPTPVQDIFYKLCCLKDVKRCYIQSRVRAMRRLRLTATIIQTILCIVEGVAGRWRDHVGQNHTKATLCYHLEIFQSSMVGAGIPRMVRSRRRDIL